MKKIFIAVTLFTSIWANAQEQSCYWQQQVDYKMDVDMNVENFQYTGDQELKYTNNSPDTLKQVFYHMFFNAFQPGSEMDMRLQSISDPDGRMVNNLGTKEEPKYESRISKLQPNEIGYLRVVSLKQEGKDLKFMEKGTVLQVTLAEALAPGKSTTLNMNFKGQVPVQIRRSGRNNADGVALSMTQWYPKLAEYDFEGWHADPYIAREFFGVWGDFNVKISIDREYILGGTGVLQNADEIGYGYEKEGTKVKRAKGDKLTWNFKAENVHDFAWAADPEYIHDTLKTESGVMLHFLYKNDPKVIENWKKIQPETEKVLNYFNTHIGPYPWKQYSVIQGGDGGMEYANCTLITGGENYNSLMGTTVHEFAHSWFQQLLGTNESQYPWMDEGFTSYISTMAQQSIAGKQSVNPFVGSYRGYNYLVESGKEQPMSTHGDRFEYNMAYSIASYTKGSLFLSQLGYLIGAENLQKTLNRYYDEWKFKHPSPNDFIRVAEKVSGAELSWYLNDWTNTTNTIDYAVKDITTKENVSIVNLERKGIMPMPLDVVVSYTDGTEETFYVPLAMMNWQKPAEANSKRTVLKDWSWGATNYSLELSHSKDEIAKVEIDPSGLMADIHRDNNVYSATSKEETAETK